MSRARIYARNLFANWVGYGANLPSRDVAHMKRESDTNAEKNPTRKLTPLRCLVAALLLWLGAGGMGIGVHWREVAASWRGSKVPVPTVTIESDDWGGQFIVDVEEMSTQRQDAKQSTAVERLVELLKGHRDSTGRTPVITAFVIVGQADVPAIASDPEFRYHWQPIDRNLPRLVAVLNRAQADGFFDLQYHARDHWDAGLFALKVKESVQQCRTQGRPFDPRVVATFHPEDGGERDRIISEYYDSRTGYLQPLAQSEVDKKVFEGGSEFARMFHKRPVGTVAPRYICGPAAERAWIANGIRYAHGINCQGGPQVKPGTKHLRQLGYRTETGMVGTPRNVHFDAPRLDPRLPSVDDAVARAVSAVQSGQPVVISTHSWNYYDLELQEVDAMFQRLDALLSSLEQSYPNLRWLTSGELGRLAEGGTVEAIDGKPSAAVRQAKGFEHAWLSAVLLYHARAKLRYWVWGLMAMVLLVVIGLASRVARRPARTGPGRLPA